MSGRLHPGEQRPCGSCGTMLVGALSYVAPTRQGAPDPSKPPAVLPVELKPDPEKGNVLLQRIDGELRAIVFGKSEHLATFREYGVQLRRCHFADCPDADRYRRRPPTRPEGTT